LPSVDGAARYGSTPLTYSMMELRAANQSSNHSTQRRMAVCSQAELAPCHRYDNGLIPISKPS
jgi:hypothetical protein